MERVAEAGFFRHLLDQGGGLLEQFGGEVHFQPQQILIRTLVVILPEKAAKIGMVEAALGANLPQGLEPPEVLLNMLAAPLIGGKGQRLPAFQWGA
jgi:hypothetical protein